ncbi:MAG: division/cell wall cluster transcriptional repressor MraZ [Deltaproteobacteria bacterium CG07_land_8_20_14_0_80_38_7]|nr:MAG: division/cell wall cluster transcriptional repressor MraZ [Deltaproteobacteria bacterium CG07_land_8_20_14_0_80_38_7]
MFRGRFHYRIDAKGRLSVPSKFREILSSHYTDERLIITNFDQCLWAYPLLEWQELEKKVSNLPQFLDEVISLQRVFISAATECPVDKQGRILIPSSLREYAAIDNDVVIVGMTKRIEIWAKERWTTVFEEAQKKLEGLGNKLADLGL